MEEATWLIIDKTPYNLQSTPSVDSPIVLSALRPLPRHPALETLTSLLQSLRDLHPNVKPCWRHPSEALLNAFDQVIKDTRAGLGHINHAIRTVLIYQQSVYEYLAGATSHGVSYLLSQKNLSRATSNLCSAYSDHINRLVVHIQQLEILIQIGISESQERLEQLRYSLTNARAKSASAYEAHAAALEQLSDNAKMFTKVAQQEREAARKANMYGVFSFVRDLDAFLQERSVGIMGGFSQHVDDAQNAAVEAHRKKQDLMEEKRLQRQANGIALREVRDCEKTARNVGAVVQDMEMEVEVLDRVFVALREISEALVRLSSFWRDVGNAFGRDGAQDLISLVRGTICTGRNKWRNVDVVDVGARGPVPVPAAVKRRFVLYYGLWVAFAEVFREALMKVGVTVGNEMEMVDEIDDIAARLDEESLRMLAEMQQTEADFRRCVETNTAGREIQT